MFPIVKINPITVALQLQKLITLLVHLSAKFYHSHLYTYFYSYRATAEAVVLGIDPKTVTPSLQINFNFNFLFCFDIVSFFALGITALFANFISSSKSDAYLLLFGQIQI